MVFALSLVYKASLLHGLARLIKEERGGLSVPTKAKNKKSWGQGALLAQAPAQQRLSTHDFEVGLLQFSGSLLQSFGDHRQLCVFPL